MMSFGKPPIIVVAAGRSGTKMLRGILASQPDTICFPREINYIWRHGNALFPTDELEPAHARPQVIRYIRRRFERLSAQSNDAQVIEKTCANSLRVDFVHAVFPEAYVIHLIRDGRAVAESARRRWQTPNEWRYLLEKARWVPLNDVPLYTLRYLRYRLSSRGSKDSAYSSWGPRFSGLDRLVTERTLIEVCGLQWRACVEAADESLKRLPLHQAISVRYEDLVRDPVAIGQEIFARLNLSFSTKCRTYIEREVHRGNLSKWKKALSEEDLNLLTPHIASTLERFGYES